MGIEQLHKAAEAAGYSMATDEDSAPVDEQTPLGAKASTTLPVVWSAVVPTSTQNAWGYLTSATGWVRGYLPTFGGRAPA